ncbi:MAG: SDR family oxidoreductase [Acidimicrobiia bacterium]|nr:SDR family oxidoreductase [Acidimicrobiia bacterium]
MDLKGNNALITGGAHRVGKGITMALAAAGANVFVHYGRSDEAAVATAAEARELGVNAEIGSADLSDPSSGASLVGMAAEALGPLGIVVNSASGFPTDTIGDVTVDQLESTLRLSLLSPIMITQAFAAQVDTEGAVVSVTDWRNHRPYPDHFSYTMAKGGLEVFTRAAAVSLAPKVRVNAVALGAILPPPGKDSEYLKELAGTLPLQRTGSPELVGRAVLELLGNDFITGEIIRLDGGAALV